MTWTKCNPDDPSTYPESGKRVLCKRPDGHEPRVVIARWAERCFVLDGTMHTISVVGWQPLPPLPGEDRYCPECEGSGDIVPGSGCAACGGSGKYEDYVEQSGAARRSLPDPLDVRPPSKGALVAELNEQSERREEAEALLNELVANGYQLGALDRNYFVNLGSNSRPSCSTMLVEKIKDWKKRYDARSKT